MSRIIKAFFYSMAGLKSAFLHEMAFRQEVFLALILFPAPFFMPIEMLFKLYLLASMMAVMIVELLNSAIEAVVDKASPEIHPLAKKAKDYGSAAVFISMVHLVLAWALALTMAFGQTS